VKTFLGIRILTSPANKLAACNTAVLCQTQALANARLVELGKLFLLNKVLVLIDVFLLNLHGTSYLFGWIELAIGFSILGLALDVATVTMRLGGKLALLIGIDLLGDSNINWIEISNSLGDRQ
jgi:hypothetical protein